MATVTGKQLELPQHKRGKRSGKTMLCRLPVGLHERLMLALAAETRTLPFGMGPTSANQLMVGAIAEYVARWESIEASPEAQHAAKVLRRGRGA